jgi:hypothetical protein
MSAGNPERRVRQRIKEDITAFRARIMSWAVIPERNVIRADIIVAPLDDIHKIIQTYHWGYLHNCACVVLTRMVQEFYTNLEVVQNNDNGIVLQSTIAGHIIMVDPQVISQIIGVLVLKMKLYCLLPWMRCGNSFMLSPRVRSDLLPSRLVLCLPRTACFQ